MFVRMPTMLASEIPLGEIAFDICDKFVTKPAQDHQNTELKIDSTTTPARSKSPNNYT